jgi:thiol-disulfide isomerase/thioredoxin
MNINKPILVLIMTVYFSMSGAQAQAPRIVKWEAMQSLLQNPSDTLYVVNFWATWCGPCVKELPHFEELGKKFTDKKLKILLVSLDFANQYESKLLPFLQKKQLTSQVVLLDETDYNLWIDKVEPQWQGAIPFTLVFNNFRQIRRYTESELNAEQLNALVEPLLSN